MLLTPKTPDVCPVQGMLFHERNGLIHSGDQVRPNLGAIEDVAPVDALEPSHLDPRVGEALFPPLTKQTQPANSRDAPALMARHESKRLQIRPAKAPNGFERLGSRSEVDRFRVQIPNRLLIVGFA